MFVRRRLTIREAEVEAILPAAHRILVCGSHVDGAANGAEDVETVGGILRMPVLDSLRPGSARKDAA